jgi:hypothetical protein
MKGIPLIVIAKSTRFLLLSSRSLPHTIKALVVTHFIPRSNEPSCVLTVFLFLSSLYPTTTYDRFAETILSAQKLKGLIDRNSKTCLQQWLNQSLKHILSILPIVFDRIETFSKPLYGFNQSLMESSMRDTNSTNTNRVGPAKDLECDVLEFLKRQEKAGGPAMAVSVVLDARGTNNIRIERGVVLSETTTTNNNNLDAVEAAAHIEWPAVYMRTRGVWPPPGGATAAGHGLLGGIRRSSTKRQNAVGREQSRSTEEDAGSPVQQSKLMKSWSTDASSQTRRTPKDSPMNVLEYAADSGTLSWPHSEWNSLVGRLTGTGDVEPSSPESSHHEEMFISLRWPGTFIGSPQQQQHQPEPESSESPPLTPSSSPPTARPTFTRSNLQTIFHISALSDYMWLVVMVKGEEESRWHRRRSRTVLDSEIREFLDGMATFLRVGDWFRASQVQKARLSIKQSTLAGLVAPSKDQHHQYACEHKWMLELKQDRRWDDDDDMQDLLHSLKVELGLSLSVSSPRRRRTTLFEPLTKRGSPYGIGSGFRSSISAIYSYNTPRSSRRGTGVLRAPRSAPSHQTSAAALFLGAELVHCITPK